MQVSTLILMTWNGAQGKKLWACSRNFVRRAMLVVKNAIYAVQLRIVKDGREVEADETTCCHRGPSHGGLLGQRVKVAFIPGPL